jgi:DNA invertase Pin-like site-specific DNA recombinase
MKKSVAIYARTVGTEPELSLDLRRAVEARGDNVVATFTDDARIEGKGKYSGWRRLLSDLDRIDQIVLADVGDPPGRSVNDVLATLATLTSYDVNVVVPSLGIDTSTGSPAVLDLISAYRRAKLGQAIRAGQAKSSERNGRPPIPAGVRRQIVMALAEGGWITPTAKKFGVSPGSIVNIRRSMAPITAEAA